MSINGKKLINPIIMILSGIMGYIFPIFNHVFLYLKSISNSNSDIAGGYEFIGFSDYREAAFCKVMCSIMIVVALVAAGVLIIVGVINLLAALKVNLPVLIQYESAWRKTGVIVFLVFACAHVIEFIFLIIFCACNGMDVSSGYSYYDLKYAPGVGAYLMMIFSVVECVAVWVVDRVVATDNGPQILFVCSACGKRVKAGSRFCDSCGGAVYEKKQYPEVYLCSSCGRKAFANNRFCAVCGGAIEKREIYPVVCFCSSCGKTATNKEKFCSGCGGAIVAKKMGPNDMTQQNAGYACSKCGKSANEKEKFCSECGGAIAPKKINPAVKTSFAFSCSSCGRDATDKDKFCSACGGAIVAKKIEPAAPVVQTVNGYFCSSCGKAAKENDKFCSACGGAVVAKQVNFNNSFTNN